MCGSIERTLQGLVGSNPSTGFKALNYTSIIPLLVGSVQELEHKIETQQVQIDSQQKELDELKALIQPTKP